MYSSCQVSIGWKISKWKYKKIKKLYKNSTSAISMLQDQIFATLSGYL